MEDELTDAHAENIRAAIKLLLRGNSPSSISDYIAKNGGDSAQVMADVAEYFQKLAQKTSPETMMGLCMARSEELFKAAFANGDFALCRGLIRDQRDLAIIMADYDFSDAAQSPKHHEPRRIK